MFGWSKIRTKTLRRVFIILVIIIPLVSASSLSMLLYFYFFSRVTLHEGLLYLIGLVPLPVGLLLSIDYTPLGIIWEGWLLISTNPSLRFTLNFLLLVPITILFLLSPLGLITNLSKFDNYENLGESIERFKSKIWGTKEGKRTVIFMKTCSTIIYVCLLFIALSVLYIIRQNIFLTTALLLFEGITLLIGSQIFQKYRQIRNQKLQV
ncbi:MAG: hypothetical protein ACETWM_16385 [Candidatus Lokiarchaeia archaeon]